MTTREFPRAARAMASLSATSSSRCLLKGDDDMTLEVVPGMINDVGAVDEPLPFVLLETLDTDGAATSGSDPSSHEPSSSRFISSFLTRISFRILFSFLSCSFPSFLSHTNSLQLIPASSGCSIKIEVRKKEQILVSFD